MSTSIDYMDISRLFIALPVPVTFHGVLTSLQYSNREIDGIRWVKKENLHVTVFFIGNINSSLIPEVTEIMKECVLESGAFELKFDGIALQGPMQKPKMVWVRFFKNDEFTSLVGSMGNRLSSIGVAASRFPEPVPHITLARIRTGTIPELLNVSGEDIRFRGCELWKSNQTAQGVMYESIDRFYRE